MQDKRVEKKDIVEEIRTINSKLRILAVLDYYGEQYEEHGNGRYRCLCPFHNDHTPSFEIYTENDSGQDSWCCYPCDENGDCFRYIQFRENNYQKAKQVANNIIEGLGSDNVMIGIKQKELQEKRYKLKKLFVVQHRLGIQYREYLKSLKGTTNYEKVCEKIDQIFQEIDSMIYDENSIDKAMKYLTEKQNKLKEAILKIKRK